MCPQILPTVARVEQTKVCLSPCYGSLLWSPCPMCLHLSCGVQRVMKILSPAAFPLGLAVGGPALARRPHTLPLNTLQGAGVWGWQGASLPSWACCGKWSQGVGSGHAKPLYWGHAVLLLSPRAPRAVQWKPAPPCSLWGAGWCMGTHSPPPPEGPARAQGTLSPPHQPAKGHCGAPTPLLPLGCRGGAWAPTPIPPPHLVQ